MKSLLVTFVAIAALSATALAQNTTAPTGGATGGAPTGAPPPGGPMGGHMGPGMHPMGGACHQVIDACKAGGFKFGGAAQGDGVMEQCVKPIVLEGKSVTGPNGKPVAVSGNTGACKDQLQKWAASHPNGAASGRMGAGANKGTTPTTTE